MATAGVEQQRLQGMLSSLQQSDPLIDQIVAYSKFVVAYLLQQDGPNPGWRKANIEGPVYLVRRRGAPRYQLQVKNQFTTNDLLDDLHADWELDCQKNYVFYKVEDPSKQIRGLWFHDDAERQRIEGVVEKTLTEIRKAPQEPQHDPPPLPMAAGQTEREAIIDTYSSQQSNTGTTKSVAPVPAAAQESVTITASSLKSALHALADDDAFISTVMQKLKDTQRPSG